MRLFIAISIPDQIKDELADLQQPIRGVRWQDKDEIHLTLKFLGGTEQGGFNELRQYLDEIDHKAFEMNLNGFGYFPPNSNPKVLWAGIEKNESLLKLQKKIEHTCSELGFEEEDRPFRPHITIARTGNASKKEVMSFINEHKKFLIPGVPVREFILFESELHSDGAVHTPVQRYPLSEHH